MVLPLFISVIFYTLVPFAMTGHLRYEYPWNETWVNSLDSREKVETFVKSKAAFGREQVVIHVEDGKANEPCLGYKHYPLIQGLERIKKNRIDHQVMLVFKRVSDYQESMNLLILMQHDWIWLHFAIEQGPFDNGVAVNLTDFSTEELKLMTSFQLAFGFTTDTEFGKGEYLREKMEAIAKKTDQWYTRLEYRDNFIVELSMHVLLNTTDKLLVLTPFTKRTMYVCFATTKRQEPFAGKFKGVMQSVARKLGGDRVYLNIPDTLRTQLNVTNWFPVETSGSGGCNGRRVLEVAVVVRVVLLLIQR